MNAVFQERERQFQLAAALLRAASRRCDAAFPKTFGRLLGPILAYIPHHEYYPSASF